MENWRYVVGYEGLYSVSDMGRVKSHCSCTDCNGWMMVDAIDANYDKELSVESNGGSVGQWRP